MRCHKCSLEWEDLYRVKIQLFCRECLQELSPLYEFNCLECEESPATFYCDSCEQFLCRGCSPRIHNKGKRAQHKVVEVLPSPYKIIIFILESKLAPSSVDSLLELSLYRERLHKQSDLLVIFQSGPGSPSFQQFLNQCIYFELKKYPLVSQVHFVDFGSDFRKVHYDKTPKVDLYYVKVEESSWAMEHLVNDDLVFSRSMSSLPSFTISTSSNQPVQRSKVQHPEKRNRKKFSFPIFQNHRLVSNSKCLQLQKELFDLAEKGILMHNLSDIPNAGLGLETGVLRLTKRVYNSQAMDLVSLNLQFLSLQSLVWAITSIKLDKMTPYQKLIISRVKECFNLKISPCVWDGVISYLKSPRYFSQVEKCPLTGKVLPKLVVKKSVQNTIEEMNLIFLEEEWVCEDQGKLDEDDPLWKNFLQFIENYFGQADGKSIPGGRYGCVQFVKNSAEGLGSCSLGKLILFVQEAINKGVIRYHRTQIVKNTTAEQPKEKEAQLSIEDKSFSTLQKEIKIKMLQDAFLQILIENMEGVSLAQIPQNIKKKVPFAVNFNQLGFAKLKNFINSMPDLVTIEAHKSNYSFAQLSQRRSQEGFEREKERFYRMVEQLNKRVRMAIQHLLIKHRALTVDQLQMLLTASLGSEFDPQIFMCQDFCQFVYYLCQNEVLLEQRGHLIVLYPRPPPVQEVNKFYKFDEDKGLFDWHTEEEDEKECEQAQLSNRQSKFIDDLLGDDQPDRQTVIENTEYRESSLNYLQSIDQSGKINISMHSKTQSLDLEVPTVLTHTRQTSLLQPPLHNRFNSTTDPK